MSQIDPHHKIIAALRNASNSWAAPNERPEPSVPILRPTPTQTRRTMKILERKLKQPAITHHPTPRVHNLPARCELDPRRKIHKDVPVPSLSRNPKETPQSVHPIVRRTMSHTQNTQPPVSLSMQLKQYLLVTPSQVSQQYFPKALLYI